MTPLGFLSSLTREHRDLRREVHEACKGLGGIYVDEINHPRTFPLDDPLEAVDELLVAIRNAELFVCILGGSRHGSAIEGSRASYFEIELYQAALLQKRPLILALPDFSPDPKLAEVLELLQFSLPSDAWIQVRNGYHAVSLITQNLEELLYRTRWPRMATRIHLRRFVTQMWRRRAAAEELDGGTTPLRFLEGRVGQPAIPRRIEVQKWIAQSLAEADQEKRLARLWIAVKELVGAPYGDPRFEAYAPLWNEVLTVWAKPAAWYGLHGHMPLGRLAALKTVEDVRRRMRTMQQFKSEHEALGHPAGAIASGHYSIAKLLMTRRGRRWHFEEAHRQVARGLQDATEPSDGLLAIRGSVNLHTGHLWAAVRDYEEVVRIREARGAETPVVGEARAELGFAYLLTGRLIRGRRLIREGVDLLEGHGERGFVLRALRKQTVAEYLTGRWRDARASRELVRTMAAEHNIRDQVKWL
jgi:hypothetical protein